MIARFAMLAALLLTGCSAPATDTAPEPETAGLDGRPLFAPDFPDDRRARLLADYEAARDRFVAEPGNPEAVIWYGRRAAYLWRYREAVAIFSTGIAAFPDDARLYRHRGHRYITLRQFHRAVADLARAAVLIEGHPDTVEPDGAPNAAGIPRSTLHTNIWYHLGLAHYLLGDFGLALDAFRRCLDASTNDDMYVATADWLYMTLRRLGREEEAEAVLDTIYPDMDLLENHAYHRRLLMYKGLLRPEALLDVDDDADRALTLATQGYGVGNWYLYHGDSLKAREVFEDVTRGDYWSAFGFIAAEADLHRMTTEAP